MPLPPDDDNTVYSPWRAGVYAARVNLVPGLVLQAAAVALLVSYYASPGLREALGVIETWKRTGGYAFSALLGAVNCGLLPWLICMAMPKVRPRRPVAELAFGMAWWGFACAVGDFFYRCQGQWWGTGNEVRVVVIKVAVDMFIYTPLYASPVNALLHRWKALGFPLKRTGPLFPPGWYRRIVLPNLIPNWVLWIPGVAIVYSLPPLLQVPMANLICCFWALLCISIAAADGDGKAALTATKR